jgi:chromosome segregation ATPase
MANGLNLPPVLQEFEGFLNVCKKMSVDLSRAGSRLNEIETELAKEKAERRQLQQSSEKKLREVTAQLESLREEHRKKNEAAAGEITQLRSILAATQNEHESVVKIVQADLERAQAALQQEMAHRAPVTQHIKKLNAHCAKITDLLKKERENVALAHGQIDKIRKEYQKTCAQLQNTQESRSLAHKQMQELEQKFKLREQELLQQLEAANTATKAEFEAKTQLTAILANGKDEYDRLFKMAHAERESVKQLRAELAAGLANHEKARQEHAIALKKARESGTLDSDQAKRAEKEIRARDEEVIRLQEQLIKLKRNIKDADDARKSTQYLANQLKAELTEAHAEITKLRSAQPLKVLLDNKLREIHEISNQLSELAEGNPRRTHLITRLDSAIQEKAAFERLISEASPSSNN